MGSLRNSCTISKVRPVTLLSSRPWLMSVKNMGGDHNALRIAEINIAAPVTNRTHVLMGVVGCALSVKLYVHVASLRDIDLKLRFDEIRGG